MYNFDEIIDRKHTGCIKWDTMKENGIEEDVIPLWVADMDFKVLPEISDALIKRAMHPIYGYSMITDEYYEAVINWMKTRHNLYLEKEWIVTTPGVVTALKFAIQAYTKENDAILINKPVYHPFDASIRSNNRKVIENQMILKEGTYQIDFNDFENKIIEHDVKMFILCNPYNPIGKVWTKEELKKIGDLCRKYNVIVVVDEIHQDFVYEGYKHIPFFNVEDRFKDFSIICTAPSKTFNLAAMQTSNIFIANKQLRDQFLEVKDKNGIMEPNVFGMTACKTAYTYGAKWVDELLVYLQQNINYLISFFETNLPDIKVIHPQGLYLVWVDFTSLGLNQKELETFMLEKAHVWLDEGYIFGTGGAGFERINVACPRSILEKALNQILEAVNELGGSVNSL